MTYKGEKLIFKDKMVRYPKHEQEADRKLLKDMNEIINTIKQVIEDKENDGTKQDTNS